MNSWGRYPKTTAEVLDSGWRHEEIPHLSKSLLPFGNGRSYGDSCLNDGGALLWTRGLNHYIAFDPESGLLKAEAGVRLDEILELLKDHPSWFLPVTPGTKFITLGGALANDVHGKNHHVAGNFSHHVTRFELLRSDGTRKICSPLENADWFHATIGGLGLTGLITWVEIQLKKVTSQLINQEIIKYESLDHFFELSSESETFFEYTVAWVDCLARGHKLGRGHFIRGNHAGATQAEAASTSLRATKKPLNVPIDFPGFALNPLTVGLFNFAYYNKQLSKVKTSVTDYEPFFYPLDSILNWNRIYGKRGFLQYQMCVPFSGDQGHAIREIFERIAASGLGSFLAVLKVFGHTPSLGMLSFPKRGVTLALDFPNSGPKLFALLESLDAIVRSVGGCVYPAKDARMSEESFKCFYPKWAEFRRFVDPRFSSSFARRVGLI
ncbi:FAD-binding oxidoreductase [Bdellovibrionota bacterium FG-2]